MEESPLLRLPAFDAAYEQAWESSGKPDLETVDALIRDITVMGEGRRQLLEGPLPKPLRRLRALRDFFGNELFVLGTPVYLLMDRMPPRPTAQEIANARFIRKAVLPHAPENPIELRRIITRSRRELFTDSLLGQE